MAVNNYFSSSSEIRLVPGIGSGMEFGRNSAMKIALLRHAKVNWNDPFYTTAAEFNAGRKSYDAAAISSSNLHLSSKDFPVCYVSPLPRAKFTAAKVYDGFPVIAEELVEVMNASNFLKGFKLPTFLRSAIGRIAWLFNSKALPENRRQSMERARRFIALILSRHTENILLVSHGFFIRCLARALREQGFRGQRVWFPRNVKIYTFVRNQPVEKYR